MEILKVFITILLCYPFSAYAQGGHNGGGGPGIMMNYIPGDTSSPYINLYDTGNSIRDNSAFKNFLRHKMESTGCNKYLMGNLNENLLLLSHCMQNKRNYNELNSPIDIEIEGRGVIDLQSFKELVPKRLWREEEDRILIDRRIPILNYQNDLGERFNLL